MTQTKQTSFVIFVMISSFMLGWYSQGYRIYSGFYNQTGSLMQETVNKINGGK